MRVWTDTAFVEVLPDKDGAYYISDIVKALRFKAQNIKAHADPEVFEYAAGVLQSVDELVDKMPHNAAWRPIEFDGYADGHPVYDVWECSCCGNEIRTEDPPKFCCNCGSCMGIQTTDEVSEN